MDTSKLNLSSSCQIPILSHYYKSYLPQNGLFVEVGAYDGESYSNTSGLADAGWRGIYVEPVPEYAQKCLLRHQGNNVSVFNYAISDTVGELDLHIGEALSSASNETIDAYANMDWASGQKFESTVTVKSLTLDVFLSSIQVQPNFDLLVVDVEGFEESVFKGFSISTWRPKMMIVELIDYHPSFIANKKLQQSSKKVREFILGNDYKQVYSDFINTIFII
jgi:FkbM family methyltransferase